MNYLIIEPVGTMENYKVSPFSADGYYNADAGSAQDTLNRLLAQLPDLQKKVNDAGVVLTNSTAALNTLKRELSITRQKALDCDAARAQHSTSVGKNKACDINLRGSLYASWSQLEKEVSIATQKVSDDTSALNGRKNDLETLKKNIDDATAKAKESLKSDPTYATEQAKLDAQTRLEQQRIAAKKSIDKSNLDAQNALNQAKVAASLSKTKFIIGSVVVIGILTGAYFIWKKYKSVSK